MLWMLLLAPKSWKYSTGGLIDSCPAIVDGIVYVGSWDDNVYALGTAVTFTESGLPSGTSWSVTFNGATQSSSTNTIIFLGIAYGSYSWSASTPISGGTGIQYVAPTSTGSITVPTVESQAVTYTTQYAVTFSSSGLSGDATGNLVTFSVSGGSYSGADQSDWCGWWFHLGSKWRSRYLQLR